MPIGTCEGVNYDLPCLWAFGTPPRWT